MTRAGYLCARPAPAQPPAMPTFRVPPQFVLLAYTAMTLVTFVAVAGTHPFRCA